MPNKLITPHGGELKGLAVDRYRAVELREASRGWPSLDLEPRQLCDLELLLNGSLSPLGGFMGQRDYEAVCAGMRLADGALWPIPVTLDVPPSAADTLLPGASVALRDSEGLMIAALHVEEVWQPDLEAEAAAVFGVTDRAHPGVSELLGRTGSCYVAGKLEGVCAIPHHDFRMLRVTPAEVRADFARLGWRRVVAYHTTTELHRAEHALTLRAVREVEGSLLIHPAVGLETPDDARFYAKVRSWQAVVAHYPRRTARLALLPLAGRQAGPKMTLLNAIIRRNYGCSHFIVDCGPGSGRESDRDGEAALELLRRHEAELGVLAVRAERLAYVPGLDQHSAADRVPDGLATLALTPDELQERLEMGREIPSWFTFQEVEKELRRAIPPRSRCGFTVFFTGLSGSGKSTIAHALLARLLEIGGRPVTLLDGDIVRRNLSSELGFSREHRDLNIRRIGFVASEITKNGGVAICAPIAPYDMVRRENRALIGGLGGYILVHVATPVEVCEARDRKGLYAKARAGLIKGFTGVDDPYEEPDDADVVVDTTDLTPAEAAQTIILHLEHMGYIGPNGAGR